MRARIIAGNWKMNGTRSSVPVLLEALRFQVPQDSGLVWVVFPPAIFLERVEEHLKGSTIAWGGQNLCAESQGAFTGGISGTMLREFGCQYVLIGHSERRTYFGESDARAAEKFAIAKRVGLIPMLCIGESLAEYEQNVTFDVLKQQLDAIAEISSDAFAGAMIAYEPVWAIGTGQVATPECVQKTLCWIRQYVEQQQPGLGDKLSILYGGSVKADNARELFALPDLDGVLVGGASLNPEEFVRIGSIATKVQF